MSAARARACVAWLARGGGARLGERVRTGGEGEGGRDGGGGGGELRMLAVERTVKDELNQLVSMSAAVAPAMIPVSRDSSALSETVTSVKTAVEPAVIPIMEIWPGATPRAAATFEFQKRRRVRRNSLTGMSIRIWKVIARPALP